MKQDCSNVKKHRIKNVNIICGTIITLNFLLILKYRITFATITAALFSLGIVTIVLLNDKYKQNLSNRKIKIALIISITLFVLWITSFIYIESKVIGGIKYSADRTDYDYFVVLGAGLKGEEISFVLKQRLDKTIEVTKNNKEGIIIVSGGQGPDEDISEAQAMKTYLTDNGVQKERILLEDKSTSTVENFLFSKELIEKFEAKDPKILVVTNDYHMYRAKHIAEKNGLVVDGVSSKTPIMVRINYLIREYYAVVKSCMDGEIKINYKFMSKLRIEEVLI